MPGCSPLCQATACGTHSDVDGSSCRYCAQDQTCHLGMPGFYIRTQPWPRVPLALRIMWNATVPIGSGQRCTAVTGPANLIVPIGDQCLANTTFFLSHTGLYRVIMPDGTLIHRLAFSGKRHDVAQLIAGISSLISHGLRDNLLSHQSREALALTQPLSLTCNHHALFASYLLRRYAASTGIRTRVVRIFALPTRSGDISEHWMLEAHGVLDGPRGERRSAACDCAREWA